MNNASICTIVWSPQQNAYKRCDGTCRVLCCQGRGEMYAFKRIAGKYLRVCRTDAGGGGEQNLGQPSKHKVPGTNPWGQIPGWLQSPYGQNPWGGGEILGDKILGENRGGQNPGGGGPCVMSLGRKSQWKKTQGIKSQWTKFRANFGSKEYKIFPTSTVALILSKTHAELAVVPIAMSYDNSSVADPGGLGGLTPSQMFFFACQHMKIPADLDPNPPLKNSSPELPPPPRRISRSAPALMTTIYQG